MPAIAKVAFTSEDRVRDVVRNFNADGFASLYPRYNDGRPPKFTLARRREIKKVARSPPSGASNQLSNDRTGRGDTPLDASGQGAQATCAPAPR